MMFCLRLYAHRILALTRVNPRMMMARLGMMTETVRPFEPVFEHQRFVSQQQGRRTAGHQGSFVQHQNPLAK
jgi:hypothetical protein